MAFDVDRPPAPANAIHRWIRAAPAAVAEALRTQVDECTEGVRFVGELPLFPVFLMAVFLGHLVLTLLFQPNPLPALLNGMHVLALGIFYLMPAVNGFFLVYGAYKARTSFDWRFLSKIAMIAVVEFALMMAYFQWEAQRMLNLAMRGPEGPLVASLIRQEIRNERVRLQYERLHPSSSDSNAV